MCTFSTSQLPKGVQLFICPLSSYLRTRRFSEPTCRPPGATKHWKNTVFRDFPTFSRTCIFSLLTLSLSDLLPSDFLHVLASSWLCFSICPYCRKFSFQTSFDDFPMTQQTSFSSCRHRHAAAGTLLRRSSTRTPRATMRRCCGAMSRKNPSENPWLVGKSPFSKDVFIGKSRTTVVS